MKRTILFLILTLCFLHGTMAQETAVTGKVVDNATKEPMEFVNVVACSLPDTAFIKGVTTNAQGEFTLTELPADDFIIKISYVGYKTKYIPKRDGNVGDIALEADANMLKGVTVKADAYSYNVEGVTAQVKGTFLSKMGNVEDVIRLLPFISVTGNGGIEVFGKGAPVYYINNRKVRNNEELKRINSANVKSIDVVVNPGAEYDSSVNAVIRIYTTRPQGEGLSGSVDASLTYKKALAPNANIDLNYRKNNLDVFLSVGGFSQNNRYKTRSETSFLNTDIKNQSSYKNRVYGLSPSAGFNYVLKNKHYFGMRYSFEYIPRMTNLKTNSVLDIFNNGVEKYKLDVVGKYEIEERVHMLNAYYNWQISKKSYLQWDFDFMAPRGTAWQPTENKYKDGTTKTFRSTNVPGKDIYAGKLVYSVPALKGKIKTGIEIIYTKSNNKSTVEGTVETPVKSSENESKQFYTAAFAEYLRSIGKLSFNAGLRFESTKFNYYDEGIKNDDASNTASGLYPTLSLAYNNKGLFMSLAYKYSISRPSYMSLSSIMMYNNPYSYSMGNPLLKDANIHNITYIARWKDLSFQASYRYMKNNTLYVDEIYDGIDSVIISRPVNIKKQQRIAATLSYSPTIGKWSPRMEASVFKPILEYGGMSYNKPMYVLKLTNIFQLPKDFNVVWQFTYTTKRNSSFEVIPDNFVSNAYLSKSFMKGKLRVNLNIGDIFYTSNDGHATKYVNGIHNNSWSSNTQNYYMLSLTYVFNQTRSKYKGTGAGDSEKSRLQ